jgi:hypothetical protein
VKTMPVPVFSTSGPIKAVSPTMNANGYNDSAMKSQQDRRTISDRCRTRTVRKPFSPLPDGAHAFSLPQRFKPKEMLLVDKPIIQCGVEEAVAAGGDQIIMITGRG